MRKLFKISIVGVILLVSIPFIIIEVVDIQHKALFKKVNAVVKDEVGRIEIPNEITEASTVALHGCNYDYKMKMTRCSTRYTNYYITDNPPEEFKKIDKHFKDLGWTLSYHHKDGKKSDNVDWLSDFANYTKVVSGYKISLDFSFYEKEYEIYHNSEWIKASDIYSGNEFMYSIRISTDIIKPSRNLTVGDLQGKAKDHANKICFFIEDF